MDFDWLTAVVIFIPMFSFFWGWLAGASWKVRTSLNTAMLGAEPKQIRQMIFELNQELFRRKEATD